MAAFCHDVLTAENNVVKLYFLLILFQTCVLGLTRSDYMVDYASSSPGAPDRELRLRQIEINTISSSFFALTQDRVQNLQQ